MTPARFEDQYPREAAVLMERGGRLCIHVFSDGVICDHQPRLSAFTNPLNRPRCPVCKRIKP